MPVVRGYGPRKVATDALAGVRRSAAETPESMGAGLARAQGETADAVGRLAGTVTQIGTQEIAAQRARAVQVQDDVVELTLTRQLSDFAHQTLHDPTTGAFHTVKGKDALGLTEKVLEQYDPFASGLTAGLPPRQQARAQRLIEQQRASIVRSTDLYGGDQIAAYEETETKAGLAAAVRDAVTDTSADPTKISEGLSRAESIITTYVAHKGGGPALRDEMLLHARTQIHAGVIDEQLAQGHDEDAAFYFAHHKDQIDPDVATKITAKLEVATASGAGFRASEAIWKTLGPNPLSDDASINIDTMETAARAQFPTDAKARGAAISFLRERAAGVKAGRAERDAEAGGTLWKEVAKGTPLAQIQRLPEYLDAKGSLQAQITANVITQTEHRASRAEHVTDRAYTLAQRAKADTADAQQKKGWATYWELSDPATLTATSENHLLMMTGEIGQAAVNHLLEAKRRLGATDDKVRAATIDDDLFKTIAQSAGLAPYASNQGDEEKATLGRLKNDVEAAIALAERKGPLSREAKGALMHTIVDEKVMVTHWYGDEARSKATVVHADDQASAYVPVAQIPKADLIKAVNLIRATVPRMQDPRLTIEAIAAQWQDRIQSAYAARVLKLGAAEESRRLFGR